MRAISSAVALLVLLISAAGCAAPGDSGRESNITTYGTIDAGVSVTRDR